MSFQSLAFLAFLLLTLSLCLTAGRRSTRTGMTALLAASVVFYLWGTDTRRLLLSFLVLLAGAGMTLAAGRDFRTHPERKRTVLTLALLWHIGVLIAFKYTGFLTGGTVNLPFVPLGLSFFTFQQIWFLKESYTGAAEPAPTGEFLLYTFFFPTVTSGPILRPGAFFPQLKDSRFLHPDWEDVAAGVYTICCGTMKKVLLADSFGKVVNNGWNRVGDLNAPAAWLVILGYTLQLYFDFSGYCDIAAGCGRLLGIRLPMNFDSPYRSLSVTEFWKRWHITLTTFLRECLYFPLGGSKKGTGRTYLNIMIIFLVSGIWHGAGWTFIVWGALHGLGQVTERLWGKGRDRLPRLLRWGITFLFVNIAWVFFRAPSFAGAWTLLHRAVTAKVACPEAWILDGLFNREIGALEISFHIPRMYLNCLRTGLLYGFGLLTALWPKNALRQAEKLPVERPAFLVWTAVLALLTAWSVLSFTGITTFIYSNF